MIFKLLYFWLVVILATAILLPIAAAAFIFPTTNL